MRSNIIIAATICVLTTAAAFSAPRTAEASDKNGSYCVKYAYGGSDCGFTSLAQCDATASGLSADCYAAAPQLAASYNDDAYAFYRPGRAQSVEPRLYLRRNR